MTQPTPAQKPFALPRVSYRTTYIYGTWDSGINMPAYFERAYGKTTASIDDDRPYAVALIDYLIQQGAELVTSSVTIKPVKESVLKDDDDSARRVERIFAGKSGRDFSYLYWYKGALIDVSDQTDGCEVKLCYPHDIDGKTIHAEFAPFLVKRANAAVSILLSSDYGMTTKSVAFDPPVIDDLELNYGVGFAAVHAKMMEKLNSRRAGLIMMHGVPGTGKSTYIKHLTGIVDREFIFIPVGMSGKLADPDFLKILTEHEGAVLVLEDAEQSLTSRETDAYNSSTVASLLNLTDGILGTLLNITIIATYNADKQTIDKALLRKGRLMYDYTFGKLSPSDARRLATHLKKDATQFTEPTSLADIYNAEDNTGYVEPTVKSMGFGFAARAVTTTPKT